jgi:hypothetical protein
MSLSLSHERRALQKTRYASFDVLGLGGTSIVPRGYSMTMRGGARPMASAPATRAVPEPGILPLMAAGVGLWLAFRFRLQRRSKAARIGA